MLRISSGFWLENAMPEPGQPCRIFRIQRSLRGVSATYEVETESMWSGMSWEVAWRTPPGCRELPPGELPRFTVRAWDRHGHRHRSFQLPLVARVTRFLCRRSTHHLVPLEEMEEAALMCRVEALRQEELRMPSGRAS